MSLLLNHVSQIQSYWREVVNASVSSRYVACSDWDALWMGEGWDKLGTRLGSKSIRSTAYHSP
jgi:hypothetical protein